MPVHIRENYNADGWRTLEVSGHNFVELHSALEKAIADDKRPYAIICETTMGKGVSFMENRAEFHGRALKRDECHRALAELGVEDNIDDLLKSRGAKKIMVYGFKPIPMPMIKTGTAKTYKDTMHPREAFGNALEEIAGMNQRNLIAVFDCDLADSVKTRKFADLYPQNFFEAGVSEHTTATIAGVLSINGILTIWADFGVFGIDEVYNQLRLNDINNTHLKIVATHLGYNVGPDGKTHHCIDYIGLLRNLFGYRLLIPCDPNQTDHMTRYMLNQQGNYVMGLSRTKLPIVQTEDGQVFFDEDYRFTYGKIDLIRDGNDCVLFTLGAMVAQAISAWNKLKAEGIGIRIYNIPCPFNIDREIIIDAAATNLIISYEDHNVSTGLGSIIAQIIAENNVHTDFVKIGISEYGSSGEPAHLYQRYSLDADSLVRVVKENLKVKKCSSPI